MARVVVVGAGVAGLGVAWALARRGHAVRVLDRGEPGRGASWAAAGMLAPGAEIGFDELDLYALGRDSLARWPAFARELEAAAGRPVGYRTEGTLVAADDRDSARALRRLYRFQREHGVPVEWLTGDEAAELEPLVSPRIPGAILSPDDHQVDNRAVVDALLAACRAAGVELAANAPVRAVEAGPLVHLQSGHPVGADAVVIAAGVGSAGIAGLDPPPPVRPVKGQALALRMTDALRVERVVRGPRAYLVPKSDGRLVVGATSEDVGPDTALTAGGLYRLLEGAVRVVPGVEEMEIVETWVGLRPASRDHAPILGRARTPGVVYATGHYRHGILLLPATAELVADEVERVLSGDAETAAALAPFSPLRFA